MRLLILMRGAPGCGKSTFIKEHQLEEYTLCADDFRLKYSSPLMSVDGGEEIDQRASRVAWEALYDALEARMKKGCLTVVDACNSKATELNKYKDLMEIYRYRCWVVDFTDIPIEEVKRRNKQRDILKQVSDDVIEKYYARQEGQEIPARFQIVSRDAFDSLFAYTPKDFSEYKSIYVIGDIHGCYTALKEAVPEIDPENLYIFVGDYLDRGIENEEVMKQMLKWMALPNIVLLEGNHERHLLSYSQGISAKSREFNQNTAKQLESIDKKHIRMFYKKLGQCAYFNYKGQKYFVCHGGISKFPENLLKVSTVQIIFGVGNYADTEKVGESFERNNPDIIQIHGHRKNSVDGDNFYSSKNTITLEGSVEFGGYLRLVKITEKGIETISVKNNVFQPPVKDAIEGDSPELSATIEKMRNSEFITEKVLENGISSFNFNRDAFYKKEWNSITTKARGLFIQNGKIAARGYEKFFNINERAETELFNIEKSITFPVSVYKKYNGYLGLLGYDETNDSLLFCSKSTTDSDFAKWFKEIFIEKFSAISESILKYIKENNKCLVFEVIDPENDPHIIKYSEKDLILLDILDRDITFKQLPYEELLNIGTDFGMKTKQLITILNTKKELVDLAENAISPEYKLDGEFIEGFVFCGVNNFMTKVKTGYYTFWKQMREVSKRVFKLNKAGEYVGYIDKTSSLTTAEANKFYNYICNLAKEKYTGKLDIISLRERYEANKIL